MTRKFKIGDILIFDGRINKTSAYRDPFDVLLITSNRKSSPNQYEYYEYYEYSVLFVNHICAPHGTFTTTSLTHNDGYAI